MNKNNFHAFMNREYPELEVNPLWIHSISGVKIVELTRSSRGNLISLRASGNDVAVEPTEANLKEAIKSGLRAQVKHYRDIAIMLESIANK